MCNLTILPLKGGRGEEHVFNDLTKNSSINTIKLLSTMLHKAWPPELNERSEMDEKEKDVVLLKHLLTWPTWPGFLKFFGKTNNNFIYIVPSNVIAREGQKRTR